jgi:tagatose-1,6-bisphosphate aldolase
MAEADTMLKQKKSELETALSEVRGELSRVDQAQRSEAHRQLVAACEAASTWLKKHGASEDLSADAAASLAQEAESLLHDIRMGRHAI